MRRSPEFSKKIKEVRALSRENPEGKDPQFEAKKLRMEFMLQNAVLAKTFTEYIERNPTANEKDFDKFAKTQKIIHPDVTEAFIYQLQDQRDRSLAVIKEKDKLKLNRAEEIFKTISTKGVAAKPEKPKGDLELDTSYPLALILYVEDVEDFDKIDPIKNIGGFYSPVAVPSSSLIVETFPVIVINGSNPYSEYPYQKEDGSSGVAKMVEHERGHAENQALKDALKYSGIGVEGRKTVWARGQYYWQLSEHIDRLSDQVKIDLETAKGSGDWQYVLDYIFSLAKDELLAEYKAKDGDTLEHKKYMQTRKGVYDYILVSLGIEYGTPLYSALWDDYEKVLDEAQTIISQFNRPSRTRIRGPEWGSRLDINKRFELMRWVLAQIPLQDWTKQIKGTLFFEEIDVFNKAMREAKQLWDEAEHSDPPNYGWSEAIARRKNDFLDRLEEHSGVPLFSFIHEFQEDIEKLKDQEGERLKRIADRGY